MIAIVLMLAATFEPGAFAVRCSGTAAGGRLPPQVFVIEPVAQRVHRALAPLQQFEDVCAIAMPDCDTTIAPGHISARGTHSATDRGMATVSRVELEISRISGKASYVLESDMYSPGRHSRGLRQRWTMTCAPTAIPTFDTSKNKF